MCVSYFILHISLIHLYVNHFSIFKIFIKLSGDVENPGPKPSPILSFSIFQWNLNSISALNYIKLSLLIAYLSQHSSWWRRLEDILRLRLQKTSSRHLQGVLIKMNIFALVIRLQKTPSRCLAKMFSRQFQDASSG